MVLHGSWNGVDGRACVPTEAMHSSVDVLEASATGVFQSRSPFSLGVYAVDHESPSAQIRDVNAFRPLQLLWVSDVVAADRALTSGPMEG